MKKVKLLLLTAVLLLTLTGCRTRTTVPADPIPDENGETAEDQLGQTDRAEEAESDSAAEEDVRPDADAPTATDPDSDRKTYAEDADAEIVPGADKTLTQQGDGGKTPEHDANGGATGAKDATTGELTATETVPADQAENTGADESGQTAETAMLYYQTLLEDRLSGLFECQRFYIYWETAEDYHTVHKSSDEHQIILNAGAYDVSAKLQNDALIVDDGWIQRKDPGVIVKVVERSVLGSGVSSTRQAETVCGALKAREGWSGLDAVRNGRVILLSEELLSGQARRTGAAVLLAKAMYPSLFSDTDGERRSVHLLRKHTARLRPVRLFMWDERNGFDMTILVIDGQGGKLGKRLVESIKKSFPQVEVMAVGTNSAASESMMRAGADRVATGENPVIVASRTAQIIVGPMGIALADALMGEISPAMANAVAASAAYRVLIPMNLCDTYVAGVSQKSSAIMDDAMEHIRQLLTEMGDTACL